MAKTVINPNRKLWSDISIDASTSIDVQFENNGAYLCVFMGNATQSVMFTVLIGSSGNVSHTMFGSNTALTVTDGSGNGKITLSHTGYNTRHVYIIPLNMVAYPVQST